MWRRLVAVLLPGLIVAAVLPADWIPLMNGKDLEGWEAVGDGVWSVMEGGILVGDRTPGQSKHQAWLYTKREFGEFDLRLEYWTRLGGNSGVSIRDKTRGFYAVEPNYDRERTPSHNGYEIQITNGYKDSYPSGSIYLFARAAEDRNKPGDWNLLEIESRNDMIRVRLNGKVVAEHPGDPKRPKMGPIGLQLHDPNSVVLFRNIQIREVR